MTTMTDDAAKRGGWEWRRADALTPGDVHVFAGFEMTVSNVKHHARQVRVSYLDEPSQWWPCASEVAVKPAPLSTSKEPTNG